jgi:DNA-binding CsgD family transcriptional regulator
VHGLLDLDEFRGGLMRGLQSVLPSDWVSLNDLGPDPATAVVLIEPPFPPDAHEVFARLAHENPLIRRYQETHDGRAYRFSDVATPDELHALALYREFYGPIGLEHQIAFTLPHEPDRLLGVAMSRAGRDYSDAERDLLNRARPFLIQSYRNAIECSALRADLGRRAFSHALVVGESRLSDALAARGLTEREADVLRGIATGRSSMAIGDALGIAERTVNKHLEHIYRKLAVHSRSEAATLAWSLATAV